MKHGIYMSTADFDCFIVPVRHRSIYHNINKAVMVIVGVTIVLGTYKTSLKSHKYFFKQHNYSILNNFCKRSFPQEDLVQATQTYFLSFPK